MMVKVSQKEKSVIIHFAGGLGNQLFQYAYVLQLQNMGITVDCEFGTLPIRLDPNGRPWVKVLAPSDLSINTTGTLRKLLHKLAIYVVNHAGAKRTPNKTEPDKNCISMMCSTYFNIHVVKEVGFSPTLELIRSGNVFAYCQTDHWLKHLKMGDYVEFTQLDPKIYELAQLEHPLIVHVRMGDYVDNPQLGILGQEYYWNGIRSSLEAGNHGSIWLFSDAPSRAIERIPSEYRTLVRFMDEPTDSPIDTLEKMRLGTGYVLANSSLGWWGAYLTYNPEARVLVPSPWFRTQVEPNELIPAIWEKRSADWEISS